MNTKHTPGPWKQTGAFVYALNEHGTNRMTVQISQGWRNSGWRIGEEEVQATASLIAAAPELLEALQLCFDHCRLYHPGVETNNVGEAVRAAIANATGGA